MIHSVTRLIEYTECPGVFYRKNILEREEPPTEPKEIGNVVHAAIAYIIRDGMEKPRAVQKAVNEAQLPMNIDEINKLIPKAALDVKVLPENVEKYFKLKLSDEDFAPEIQGYIDLVLPDNSIIDWKSGWKFYHPVETPQLGLYAWAIYQLTGNFEVNGQLFFLRNPNKNYSHTYTKEEMDNIRVWAYDLANKINNKLLSIEFGEDTPDNLFPDTPGSNCRFCGFANECKAEKTSGEKAVESEVQAATDSVPTSDAEAYNLASAIMRLENVLKTMKNNLKEYVKEHGSVQVGDQEYGFAPSVSWEFKPDDLKAAAQEMADEGINPWEILNLGVKQIEKLQKQGWDDNKLAKFAMKKENKSFRRYKAPKEGESNATAS